jgi:hypothetical protein
VSWIGSSTHNILAARGVCIDTAGCLFTFHFLLHTAKFELKPPDSRGALMGTLMGRWRESHAPVNTAKAQWIIRANLPSRYRGYGKPPPPPVPDNDAPPLPPCFGDETPPRHPSPSANPIPLPPRENPLVPGER